MQKGSVMEAQLDHVVLLLPYQDIVSPPEWITKHFTLSPGGRHADGKTQNRLILFADGTYLELIAFIDDNAERRRGHWWDKPYGVVDYALTTPNESFSELPSILDRLSQSDTGISYDLPQEGGRHRPDGVELKWRVTFPTGVQRGAAPFFCHDLTPRDRRVPVTAENTTHACGATGMAGVLLQIPESSMSQLTAATGAILDSDLNKQGHYDLGVPHEIENAKKPSIRFSRRAEDVDGKKDLAISLVVQTSRDVQNIHHTIGDGVVSIVFEQPN